MKKRCFWFFVVVLMLFACFCETAGALPDSAVGVAAPTGVNARYVALVDMDSGEYLYAKDIHTKMYPASTTKIMTAILVLELCGDLQQIVTVGDELDLLPSGSSALWVSKGDNMTVENLMYGLMLKSGNDCGLVLAKFVCGSVSAFVEKMNEKAAELGMTDTHFSNPHGFHDKNHYTTVADMVKLTLYARQNETFCLMEQTQSRSLPCTDKNGKAKSFYVTNTNKLILTSEKSYYYQYCTGGKTGYTDEAGQCLISCASKDGQNLLAAVFYDGLSTNTKYITSKALFEYGFSTFATVNITDLVSSLAITVPVENCASDDPGTLTPVLQLDTAEPIYYTSTKTVISRISEHDPDYFAVEIPASAEAPVVSGQNLGTITVKYSDEVLFTGNMYADRSVEKAVITPHDLEPIEGTNIGNDLFMEYIKEMGVYTILLVVAIAIVIVVIILLYLRARRKVSLTKNVYRSSRRR